MKKDFRIWLFSFLIVYFVFALTNSCTKDEGNKQEANNEQTKIRYTSKSTENDLARERATPNKSEWLNGKIKSIGRYTFEAIEKSGKIIEGNRKRSYTVFGYQFIEDYNNFIKYNERGNYIEENYFNYEGTLVGKSTFKYNIEGDLIESNSFDPQRKIYNKSIYEYDDAGNKIEEINYNSDKSLNRKSTFKYDNIGSIITETNYEYKPDGKIDVRKETFKYDNKGNKIEKYFSNPNDIGYVRYDSTGKLIESNFYDPKNREHHRRTRKYDCKGKKTRETQTIIKKGQVEKWAVKYDDYDNVYETLYINPDGKVIIKKSNFKYNNKGDETERTHYNYDGSLIEKLAFEYDKRGNRIKQTTYKSGGSLDAIWTSKYDDKGNKIEENSYPDGILKSKTTYKYYQKAKKTEISNFKPDGSLSTKENIIYDEKGNEIERNDCNHDGSLTRISATQYTFDKHDNWVKKIEFKGNTPTLIIERIIEYYE